MSDRIPSKLPDVRAVPLADLGAVSVAWLLAGYAQLALPLSQQGPPPVRVAAFQSAI
jgi:hypothetical protein